MSLQLELLTENPSQWNSVIYVTPELQKKEIKPFVVLALKELEGNPDSRISSLMNADKFAAVRGVVRHMARLRSGIKDGWSTEDVKMFLESLRFSSECTSELASLLCTEQIYNNIPTHLKLKPGIIGLQWKIDLSLFQSKLPSSEVDAQKRLELLHTYTSVILIFNLTDGQTKTYNISLSKFHEVRYQVASVLKSMIVLEKRKCMRKD